MGIVLLIPPNDLTAIDATILEDILHRRGVQTKLCLREQDMTQEVCLAIFILGDKNNPALTIPTGAMLRAYNVPAYYASLLIKNIRRRLIEIASELKNH